MRSGGAGFRVRRRLALDRLAGKGMVERRPDPDDRGKLWVQPVEWYDQRVHDACATIVTQMEDVDSGDSVAELQTVLRYLNDIKDVRQSSVDSGAMSTPRRSSADQRRGDPA